MIILDGTMSYMLPGRETNAGKTGKLLREGGIRAGRTPGYAPGIRWRDRGSTPDADGPGGQPAHLAFCDV